MEFVFAKNEKVINRYPFVKTVKEVTHKSKKEVTTEEIVENEQELVITNKRLIIGKRNGDTTTKLEKDIKKIDNVSTKFTFKDKTTAADKSKGKLLIILGVIFTVLIIGLIFTFGIKLIKKGREILKAPDLHHKKCLVELTFYGVDESKAMLDVGASVEKKDVAKIPLGRKNKKGAATAVQPEESVKMEIQVNVDVAKKMAESIGADLIEAKA